MHTAANIRKYLTIISTIISKIPLTKETGVTTKQPRHAAPLIYIPLDLLAEILCRLPVNVLQQIRCVCKSWNALISDDFVFAKKHLSMSKKRQHLITATWIKPTKLILMSYEFDSLPLRSIFTTMQLENENSPVYIQTCYNYLVASCDGLLCFSIEPFVLLWNPSIRKLKKLPSLEFPKEAGRTIFAFGYDPFIDNYKVVYVFYDFHVSRPTPVRIYTLGTVSWRRIKDFPSVMPSYQHGVFFNGTVNWLASSRRSAGDSYRTRFLVSLQLENDSYQEISMLDCHSSFSDCLTLGVMRDCLCIFSHSESYNDVWLMKEYGNKESWTKLIRLPYFGSRNSHFPKIMYISQDDNDVLLSFIESYKNKWAVYDSKNDTIKCFKIQDIGSVGSEVYVESLISP